MSDAASDDSDDDSEASSDAEEVEATPQDMEAIMTLESNLQSNPQVYDLHAQVPPPLPPLPSALK